jgi:signal transduction histidine kinase
VIAPLRRLSRRWLLPGFVALMELGLASLASAQQKQVLVLYSTRRDAQIAVVGERELPRILDKGLNNEVDYYSEYIDRVRFPNPNYRAGFHDFVKVKYQGRRFDIVIAMDEVALEFAATNRAEFFPETPIVYFTAFPETQRVANSTGILSHVDMRGTVELAAMLQPDLQHVFVVSGTQGAAQLLEAMRTQVQSLEPPLSITYLTGLPTSELESRLATLPAHSMVYYLFVSSDGTGQNFHPLEYLDRLAAVSNSPIYSWVDSTMDHGIVGGNLKSQIVETQAIGELALRVLGGERADSIAISSRDLNVSQVDWRQLRRWKIPESRVPAGVTIRFQEPSAWDRYKLYILGALGVLLVQSGLIAGLLIQRARRRRAETGLQASQSELRSSYDRIRDLGVRLLHAQETERARIARELHDDITQQMSLLVIDLALLRGDGQARTLAQEAMSRVEQIIRSVRDLSHRLHPTKLRLIGLVSALRDLQHELTQADLPITLTYDPVPKTLPPDVTLCVFRVVQEALHNALKYSHAHAIKVHLGCAAKELRLTIADDGVGFDLDATRGKGLGLISIAERVEALGGTFEIRSQRGAGTALEARVPLSIVKDAGTIAV